MLKKFEFLNKSLKEGDLQSIEEEASRIYTDLITHELADLHLAEYTYDPEQAIIELGLDEELINELVADYVSQIIRSLVQFELRLKKLQESKKNHEFHLDYTPFRELAHKNLGVARNLRIKNAEILLYEMMRGEDLNRLMSCLEALEVSTIKLDVKVAYNTLKMIERESSSKN
ncbi:hypothetical protein MNB_SM-5-1280 [hydrothermal vent metagenome]|uniref:HPt domain-containing protein n=1 Tax=hydrothermal vent metagenome TaxID=652676 RepID=A0A1W1CYA5_9ZZZZ